MKRLTLSIVLAGAEPPSEFRIFAAGKNETTKGTFTFDEAAAKSVMAEYAAHGIDVMLDYDHASLGSDRSPDPAQAGKAAGWFNLEVRRGELWAVNVRWTEPAAAALRRKEWRFMSPAFSTDESGRVLSLMNVALTNLPATRRLEPLMAASARGDGMDPKLIGEALDALIAGDQAKCTEILKGLVVSAASGDPDAGTEDAPPPVGDGGADEGTEPALAADAIPPAEKKAEVAAASARLMRLTGAKTYADAVAQVELYRASHIELETERQKLAAERATLEAAERRKGCVDLVTRAGHAPATVWADDKSTTPKKYLSAMPISDFRDFVTDAIKAKGGKPLPQIRPPASGGDGADPTTSKTFTVEGGKVVTLDARELAICAESKTDPAVFALLKSRRPERPARAARA